MFSTCDNVQYILDKVSAIRIDKMKILDVGCGFGKWGFLLRGLLDGEKNGPNREEWTNNIDACEVFEPYITPMHRYLYDQIILDDFRNLFCGAGKHYNLIIMGNCLEHVSMTDGKKTIKRYLDYCDYLIVSVFDGVVRSGERLGNPAERHSARWTVQDFKSVGLCDIKRTGMLLTAHSAGGR